MKILYVSATPLAGVCELNARLVNEYHGSKHEARVLNNGPGKHRWYLRPGVKVKCYRLSAAEEARTALEWADVIACQAAVGPRNLNAIDLLPRKTWTFTWHGAEINGCLARSFEKQDYKYVKAWIHIGQGWMERQRDFFSRFSISVLPNLISIEDDIHSVVPWEKREQTAAFSPSQRNERAVNRKGIPEVKKALFGMPLKILHGMPFEECMRSKQRASLGIDEIVTGMYHRSGLEFLSQGTACVAGMDGEAQSALLAATGAELSPFLRARTMDALRLHAERILGSLEEAMTAGQAARVWMERHYHPAMLLDRYFEAYQS